jgi:hypothetical protein
MRPLMHAGLVALLSGVALAGGCAAAKTTIQGEVTLDNEPLQEGLITYVPVDGKTPNAATKIKDGKYRLDANPGAMRVQINSSLVTGKRKAYDSADSPLIDVLGERVPERYNDKTELTADVKKGENVFNWKLSSKKKENAP